MSTLILPQEHFSFLAEITVDVTGLAATEQQYGSECKKNRRRT